MADKSVKRVRLVERGLRIDDVVPAFSRGHSTLGGWWPAYHKVRKKFVFFDRLKDTAPVRSLCQVCAVGLGCFTSLSEELCNISIEASCCWILL